MDSQFRKHILAIALVAGALVASSKTASAQQASTTDPGVRCAAKVGPGQYEFYLPGERATDVNGNKWVCGPDGQWFRDYSALTTATGTYTGTKTTYYFVASTSTSLLIK
jgi:hypothetical protein